MKAHFKGLAISFSVILALAAVGLAKKNFAAEGKNHKPVTSELIQLLDKQPDLKMLLQQSLTAAAKANPDEETNPVRTLEDYYDFIDHSVGMLPQQIIADPAGSVRDQMLQGICYFYFLVGQPLPELEGKGLFKNSLQYDPVFSAWMRAYANAWGDYLDTEASWSPELFEHVAKDPDFGFQNGWYESPENWKTFNQFFSRNLVSPEVRPVAAPDDPAVVVAPADSVPQGVWPIDQYSRIQVAGGLKVKLTTYYSVEDLLGADSPYKDVFAGGMLTHTFLNVNDYHRYHFAVSGTIREGRILQQNVALEVGWDAKEGKYVPIDSTGWQFSQTRGFVIVDTGKYGLVALIPMGMAQVSSVNFEKDVLPGTEHKKGDKLGYFLFGGSDFIMLFQKHAGFEITVPTMTRIVKAPGADQGRTVTTHDHVLVGEAYGVMKG